MLLGSTGTGKSTLANALIQGPENMMETDDGKYVAKKKLLSEDEEDVIFQIGH